MLGYFRRKRRPTYEGDAVRGGAGPTDNLVVLIVSLVILLLIGAALVSYFLLRTPAG